MGNSSNRSRWMALVLVAALLTGVGVILAVGADPTTTQAAGGSFVPLSPSRVLDTRGGAKVGNAGGTGSPLTLSLFGKGGLPGSGIGAVALNVTVVAGEDPAVGGGFVTVYPCGTRPDASNLNFVGGQTIPNSVIAPVSATGTVCFYVYGTAHLIADVSGYFPTANDPQLTLESLRSVSVPSICGFPGGKLVNGELPGIEPGWVSLGHVVAIGDVDGDGRVELAVNFFCGGGGVAWPEPLVVFDDNRTVIGIIDLSDLYDDILVWRGVIKELEYDNGVFHVTVGLEVSAAEYYVRRFTVSVDNGQLVVGPAPPPSGTRDDPFDIRTTECTPEIDGAWGTDINGTMFLCIPGVGWNAGE